jgi:hypothetical protein
MIYRVGRLHQGSSSLSKTCRQETPREYEGERRIIYRATRAWTGVWPRLVGEESSARASESIRRGGGTKEPGSQPNAILFADHAAYMKLQDSVAASLQSLQAQDILP